MTSDIRVGHGHDRHQLEAGRDLNLGGVNIDHNLGTCGHSDGDVLLHSLVDAILGAICKGDIGTHFPPDDPEWQNVSSVKFLDHTISLMQEEYWSIINIDSTVFCEPVKLSDYRNRMITGIQSVLDHNPAVNVKFKTGENLGPVGKGQAIEAESIILLKKA